MEILSSRKKRRFLRDFSVFSLSLLNSSPKNVWKFSATADTISFAHFCWAIRGYVDAFRKKRVPKATADRAFKMKLEVVQQLSQEEVAGLVAWTQLAEVIALQVKAAFFNEHCEDSRALIRTLLATYLTGHRKTPVKRILLDHSS